MHCPLIHHSAMEFGNTQQQHDITQESSGSRLGIRESDVRNLTLVITERLFVIDH